MGTSVCLIFEVSHFIHVFLEAWQNASVHWDFESMCFLYMHTQEKLLSFHS